MRNRSYFDKRREERLKALDLEMQRARDSLLRQQARGFVIQWNNSFRRLQRLCARRPAEDDIILQGYIFGDAISDCASFLEDTTEKLPYGAVIGLVELLESLGNRLSRKILSHSSQCGYYGSNVKDAIIFLAREDELDAVISFLDSLERALDNY